VLHPGPAVLVVARRADQPAVGVVHGRPVRVAVAVGVRERDGGAVRAAHDSGLVPAVVVQVVPGLDLSALPADVHLDVLATGGPGAARRGGADAAGAAGNLAARPAAGAGPVAPDPAG